MTNPTPKTWDEAVDEIFRQLNASNNIVKDNEHLYDDNQLLRAFEENEERAKSALNNAVKEHVIGEYEPRINDGSMRPAQYRDNKRRGRNMFRAEQRKRVDQEYKS